MSSIQIAVDVVRQHRWLPMRRECTCGWHKRTTKSGLLNHPHHVADVLRAAGAIPAETEEAQEKDVSERAKSTIWRLRPGLWVVIGPNLATYTSKTWRGAMEIIHGTPEEISARDREIAHLQMIGELD